MNNLEPEPSGVISQLVLILVLTSLNAFFASAEMAIVSVNKSKIKKLSEEGNLKAKLLEKLMEEPSNFLSTIQIGITLAGFFSSASAATGLSSYVSNILSSMSIPYVEEISMIGVTLILSYFTLVFGELVPKRIALKKAESIALSSVKLIYTISVIAKPFIKILSISTSVVLRLTGNKDVDVEEKISEEEIKSLIAQSQEDGCIEDVEKQMIYGVFEFNDKMSKEIMTSRKDTFLIDIEDDIEKTLDEVLNSSYSRVPVYKDDVDNIIGILHTKDLLLESRKVGFENIVLEKILKKPYFVPETKKANELFKVLKEQKRHMALLFDEYGGFSGIVTMEDLIEEIMGDIEDEYDLEDNTILQLNEKTFIIKKGSYQIKEFNNKFNINIENNDYDTLNGYLLNSIGEIPTEGQEIELDSIRFKILKVGNRRVEEVEVTFLDGYKFKYCA